MKRIERPDWKDTQHFAPTMVLLFDRWFTENIEPINKAIDEAVIVCAVTTSGCIWTEGAHEKDNYQALLINIEPIKKDTAEDILRELIKEQKDWGYSTHTKMHALIVRSKKLLLEGGSDE